MISRNCGSCRCNLTKYMFLVFTKSVDSNFRAFWLALVTRNILGYSLFCERREKWRIVSRKFQKKKLKKRFFNPSDLVDTKTTIPLRVGEERWICTSTLRVSVYIHHYSPPLRGIVVSETGEQSILIVGKIDCWTVARNICKIKTKTSSSILNDLSDDSCIRLIRPEHVPHLPS